MLFMDGLADLLRGWVKALNPPTLHDAIKKARDMETSSSKSKIQTKGFMAKKDKDKTLSKGLKTVKGHAS